MAVDIDARVAAEAERSRLLRLCTALTGTPNVAEDLVQETLLEAWRHEHNLRDPERRSQWLSGIARNICLRWMRRQKRDIQYPCRSAMDEWEDEVAANVDLDIELERGELADLLDQAMAVLPAATHQTLLQRYVEDLPIAEVARFLGISEGATAVRLHRGKLALRRILLTDFPDAAAAYGLTDPNNGWQPTRLWCRMCGQQRLMGRFVGDPAIFSLRCPGCGQPGECQTDCPVPGTPCPKGYKTALTRVDTWIDTVYGLHRGSPHPVCPRCARPTPLRLGPPLGLPADLQTPGVHIYLHCDACGAIHHSMLEGIALTLPMARQFYRCHPRIRTLPHQEVVIEGGPAFLARFESLSDRAHLDVLIASDSFRLIAVHGHLDPA